MTGLFSRGIMQNLERQFKKSLQAGKTPWDDIRQKAWTDFQETGLPKKSWESWRFTPLTRIQESEFHLAEKKLEQKTEASETEDFKIVLINGALSSKTEIPKGVKFKSLSQALGDNDLDKAEWDNLKNEKNPFYGLSKAFLEEGFYLEITDKTLEGLLIKVVYQNSGSELTMCHPHLVINVKNNAHGQVIEDFSAEEGKRWTNALTKIFVAENSSLKHFKYSATTSGGWHLDQTLVNVQKNASYKSTVLYKDEGLSRNEIIVNLKAENAFGGLNGIYLPKGNGHSDHYTYINHQAPLSFSEQLYKGILEDESMAVFSGTVKVGKNVPGVNSSQLNKNLLLTKQARIETQPQLLIETDDVKCAHGATIGQIDEEELFYLQTRGIPSCRAFEMLAKAFAEEVLLNIKDKRVKSFLQSKIAINSRELLENMHV